MSILIIGDIHMMASNERNTGILQTGIMEIIDREKLAFIVILGDTLHNHKHIDMECQCRAIDLFEMIMSKGVHLFVLIGNHDRKNQKDYMSNRHPFRGINGRAGITIVEKGYVHEMDVSTLGINSDAKMKFCFMPFVPDGMYMKALQDCNINPTEMSMFFSHQEYDGCQTNKITKTKCDIWPADYPLNVSGHIHNEEIVQENLIYVGTPFQHDFTESPDKGIFLLNLVESINTGNFKLEKQKLRIPSKVVCKVHYTQLESLVLDPNYDVRLEIHGPTQYVKELMNRADMVSKFGNVSKKFKDDDEKNAVVSQQIVDSCQFYDKLMKEICTDPIMQMVHQELFNCV